MQLLVSTLLIVIIRTFLHGVALFKLEYKYMKTFKRKEVEISHLGGTFIY